MENLEPRPRQSSVAPDSQPGDERPYRIIVDQAHEGIWTIDADGCTTFVNPRMTQMLGYSATEMLGRPHTDFMFEPDRPSGDLQMELRRVGTRETWDQRYRRKDGSELWTLASCCPLYEEGRFIGALGMFTEITERKTLERALRESEARFRGTFENAAVGMAHVGLDGRWLRVNRTLCELLEYTDDELMLLRFADITHPDDLEADLTFIQRMLSREISTYSMEKRYRRKSGEYFWGELTVSLLTDDHGRPLKFISVVQDISVRRRAVDELRDSREQLIAASKAKDQFLAALSHELRTPLSPVLLLAGEAATDPATPAPLRETFRSIEAAVLQQTRIIDDLLDLTRISSGKLALKRQPLELRRFLQAWSAEQRPIAARHQVTFDFEPIVDGMTVDADAGRLRQVFDNLMGNALKFTPARGAIRVVLSADVEQQQAVLAVIDTGLGMTSDEQSRLFQRFSQGDHASHTPGKFGGLGLGLTICRGIVEQHGGTLEAYSPGPSQGSTFTVRLPLLPSAASATPS